MKRLLFLIVSVLISTNLLAVSEIQIKAVFLEKFTHLIEWPNEDFETFSICVLNDEAFANTLEMVYADKHFQNKPVNIIRLSQADTIPECQLLFIGSKTRDVTKITKQHTSNALLTVSDHKEFINNNVMITIYLNEKRFKYIINNKAAKEANIKISYLLLKSAEEVIQ